MNRSNTMIVCFGSGDESSWTGLEPAAWFRWIESVGVESCWVGLMADDWSTTLGTNLLQVSGKQGANAKLTMRMRNYFGKEMIQIYNGIESSRALLRTIGELGYEGAACDVEAMALFGGTTVESRWVSVFDFHESTVLVAGSAIGICTRLEQEVLAGTEWSRTESKLSLEELALEHD